MRDLLRQLDERYPALGRWLGGPLDVQAPALGLSLGARVGLDRRNSMDEAQWLRRVGSAYLKAA